MTTTQAQMAILTEGMQAAPVYVDIFPSLHDQAVAHQACLVLARLGIDAHCMYLHPLSMPFRGTRQYFIEHSPIAIVLISQEVADIWQVPGLSEIPQKMQQYIERIQTLQRRRNGLYIPLFYQCPEIEALSSPHKYLMPMPSLEAMRAFARHVANLGSRIEQD